MPASCLKALQEDASHSTQQFMSEIPVFGGAVTQTSGTEGY